MERPAQSWGILAAVAKMFNDIGNEWKPPRALMNKPHPRPRNHGSMFGGMRAKANLHGKKRFKVNGKSRRA